MNDETNAEKVLLDFPDGKGTTVQFVETPEGVALRIDVGGHVITKPAREWHRAVLAEQAEPVGIVCAVSVSGIPMNNSTGVEWLSPVPVGSKLYTAPPTAGTVRVPVEPTHELRQLSFTILSRLQSGTEEVVRLDDAEAALASERSRTAALEDALRWIEGETHSTPGLTIVELGVVMARIGARARASLIAAAPK